MDGRWYVDRKITTKEEVVIRIDIGEGHVLLVVVEMILPSCPVSHVIIVKYHPIIDHPPQ